MTVLWVAQAVTVTNGQKEVVVTSAPGNAITKVETSAYFHGVGFSLPYEIERTYNNGTNDVIVLYENWAGSSGSIGAVAAPSGAAVTRAANSLEELKSVYEAIADSVSTTVTANSIPQRDANGRLKAAPASAGDDVVVKSQTGTAADKDVVSSNTDTTNYRLLNVGAGGLLSLGTAPSIEEDNTLYPTMFGRDGDAGNGYPVFGFASTIITQRYNASRQSQFGIAHGGGVPRAAFRTMVSDDVWSGPYDFYGDHNINFNQIGGAGNGDEVLLGSAAAGTIARFWLDNFDLNQATGLTIDSGVFRVDTMSGTTVSTGQPSVNVSLSSLTSTIIEVPVAGISGTGELLRLRCDGGAAYATITH